MMDYGLMILKGKVRRMTLQQQAVQAVQVLPDDKLPLLIQFASFLKSSPQIGLDETHGKTKRRIGRLKGKIRMADDFNETPPVLLP